MGALHCTACRRNELVALDLLVTCITAAFTFVAMVAGIFGMNLFNATWEENKASRKYLYINCFLGAQVVAAIEHSWQRLKSCLCHLPINAFQTGPGMHLQQVCWLTSCALHAELPCCRGSSFGR